MSHVTWTCVHSVLVTVGLAFWVNILLFFYNFVSLRSVCTFLSLGRHVLMYPVAFIFGIRQRLKLHWTKCHNFSSFVAAVGVAKKPKKTIRGTWYHCHCWGWPKLGVEPTNCHILIRVEEHFAFLDLDLDQLSLGIKCLTD
jgi:hypothetical protein